MYDVILRDDLINLNKADNINSLNFNHKEMIKISKNRTKDKFYLLNYLYSENYINKQEYLEYMKIAEEDYKTAILFIMGRISLTYIE